jgi:hypothetical protein
MYFSLTISKLVYVYTTNYKYMEYQLKLFFQNKRIQFVHLPSLLVGHRPNSEHLEKLNPVLWTF